MKKIFVVLSLFFSIFLFSDSVSALVPETIGIGTGIYTFCEYVDQAQVCHEQNFEVSSYDVSIALFDRFGNDLPTCNTDLYITEDNDGNYGINRWSGITKLCNSGTSPSLDKIKQYFNYYFRVNYKNHWTDDEYHIFLIYGSNPLVYEDSWGHISLSSPDFVISTFPDNYELYNSNGTVIYGNTKRTVNYRQLNYYSFDDSIGYGTFWPNSSLYLSDLNNEYNDYLDVTSISTNFEFTGYSGNNVSFDYVNSFEFGTDTDVSIPVKNYLLLVPKKNIGFDTYIWSDSNFLLREDYYYNNSYEKVTGIALDEIKFEALNEFKWFRWDYSFSLADLNKNKVLKIFNHSDNVLIIKFKSEDFYYYVINEETSDIVVNGVTYPNDWENLNNLSSKHTIKNTYDFKEYTDVINYMHDLPTFLESFSRSFVFIGSMITSIFTIFTGELLFYYYILFGLMIIMLIIMILK